MSAGSIVLSNPGFWAAAAALLLPLVIHLLTRRTRRVVHFPSIQFLMQANASHSSWFRVRHWILLALRTLILAAILLAFLKPVGLGQAVHDPRPGGDPVVAILLIDASASMRYQGGGESRFTRARDAAGELLHNLNPDDRANVVFAGATPRSSLPEPSASRYHLLRDLREATPTLERADLDAALTEAVNQLVQSGGTRLELYLISDFQRSSWASVRLAALPTQVKTVLVPITDESYENTAISDVTLTPAAPAIDEEVEITCRITHHGERQREATLELAVGEELHTQRPLILQPGESSIQSFRLRLGRRGFREGVLRIHEDRLTIDDRRYFTLNVVEQLRVVVVTDEARRAGAVHRLLTTALNPYRNAQDGAIAAEVRRSTELGRPSPSHAQVLIVSDALAWSADTLDAILAYLNEGGSLLYFLASAGDAANLLQLEARSGGRLRLPFQLQEQRSTAHRGTPPARLAAAQLDHPALRKFRERTDLHEALFYRSFRAPRVEQAGEVLLAYGDGSIALSGQTLGAGRLLLANFSPHPTHSDLATRPLFVPLLHELVRHLRPRQQGTGGFLVGGAGSMSVREHDFTPGAHVVSPSGVREPIALDLREREASVLLGATREAGFYRVYAGDVHAASMAINVDAKESDAAVLAPGQLNDLLARAQRQAIVAGDTRAETLQTFRSGRPLWQYAVLLALGLVLLELGLISGWRR